MKRSSFAGKNGGAEIHLDGDGGIRENKALFALLLLMAVTLLLSVLRAPFISKAVYALPVLSFIVWLFSSVRFRRDYRDVLPFWILLPFGLIASIDGDLNVVKKTLFVSVYASIFSMHDFSRIRIDLRLVFAFLVVLAFIDAAFRGAFSGSFVFSILSSRSSFETSFAFPLGIIVCYEATRRNIWAGASALPFVFLFLKRIVLLSVGTIIATSFLPRHLRRLVLSRPILISIGFAVPALSVVFAQGAFDELIFDIFEQSANQFSNGRRFLYSNTLDEIAYKFSNYILSGVGFGKLNTINTEAFRSQYLFHNDLLALVLEVGWLVYGCFIICLFSLRSHQERALALFLLMLLTTDNVLVYQHVMMVYFLCLHQMRRNLSQSFDLSS